MLKLFLLFPHICVKNIHQNLSQDAPPNAREARRLREQSMALLDFTAMDDDDYDEGLWQSW